jgi:poly(ADP-ribose) glycohydrolase ARH3
MMSEAPTMTSRFRGCLLGLAVADALGAPFEGIDAYGIYHAFGSIHDIVKKPPVDSLCYTDDTQTTLGVAEALLEDGRIVEETLVRKFAENFDPARGYGPAARQVIEAARDGGDWRRLAETLLPGGSLGNGAAMRVAPVGLVFHRDPDRVWAEAALSAMPTHRHPIGIEAAQVVALAVARVCREPEFGRAAFFDELSSRCQTEELRWQLGEAARLGPDDSVARFGSSLRADRCVVTAIACFAGDPDSYAAVVARAISLGDDTDTVAAIAGAISGAISGARLGVSAVPLHLLTMLEDGVKGRAYIDSVADQLNLMT